MCYAVLIWILIFLTLGNNILLQSFNWPKPLHYIPSDEINASICIQQIFKVKIRIQRMWIFASFVTSLHTNQYRQRLEIDARNYNPAD